MTPGIILIDCDGVLTDGKLYIDHTGEKPFKAFHTRDVRAIRELVFLGYDVVIVSADDWEGGKHYANKVGAFLHVCRDKREVVERYREFIAVGDDAWDVPMLKAAKIAFAPVNCDPSVLMIPGIHVLSTKGGEGVIAEIVRVLCQS